VLELLSRGPVVFISSDFKRARETASECLAELQQLLDRSPSLRCPLPGVEVREELRERFFGELEGLPLLFYNRVWPIDSIDADNSRLGVESVNDVIRRVERLLSEVEGRCADSSIVLVSHADTLQIAQTFLCSSLNYAEEGRSVDPREFHRYRFRNGELRDLTLLPPPVDIVYK
jgi:broad specificity phosphatase PhoE